LRNRMNALENTAASTAIANESCCKECGSSQVAEDHRSGDWVCVKCGTVLNERLISPEAEYRVFSEDHESFNKRRVGRTYNPLEEYTLTESSRLGRDDKEFLWDGLKNIEDTFTRLYQGDPVNTRAQDRAKEIFAAVFREQVKQKLGEKPMKRAGGKTETRKRQRTNDLVSASKASLISSSIQEEENDHGVPKRLKFSRRKQFVVAAITQALKENNVTTWNFQAVSDLMDGISVSKYSFNNCVKELVGNFLVVMECLY